MHALKLASVPSFQDIGGYETVDGRTVRSGRLFRSGHFGRLSPVDRKQLDDAGIRLVIDLRGARDIVRDGHYLLPSGAQRLHLSAFDDSRKIDQSQRQLIKADMKMHRAALRKGDGERLMIAALMRLAFDRTKVFQALLSFLAEDRCLPAIVHCSAGKDRTGWAATLLLLALGVPETEVLAHYLSSNEYRRDEVRSSLAKMSPHVDTEAMLPLLEVRPQYLIATFHAIRQRFGSLDDYLTRAIDLDAERRRRLQANFLE